MIRALADLLFYAILWAVVLAWFLMTMAPISEGEREH